MTDANRQEFIALRRSVIAAEFAALNDMQREAVLATEGPLLLLAGAGSGKTTVLINRIANLIRFGAGADTDMIPAGIGETDLAFLRLYLASGDNPALRQAGEARARDLCAVNPVRPWEILAITFTNKAADELKIRLENKLGGSARDIWAMTFHAASVRILRRFIDRLGFDSGFTIYDTADSQSLMKRILKDLNLDEKSFPYRSVLGEISRAKDGLMDPKAYLESAETAQDYRKRHIGAAYGEYQKRLRAADALDFDDLLYFTVKLLQSEPEVLAHYQRQFRYVLIDEYQDTNNLQYLFSSLLAGGHGNICVVGDDDQSIYKFRGATIQNILNFEHQYPDARVIRLEQNYRSTGHILGAANAVIKNNMGRKGKNLWTDQADGEKLTHYAAMNQEDEATYVAQAILDHFGRGGKWGEHAVLYRMNALSNQLEYAFKRNGIPYKVIGGTRFFDRAEIKDVLAYLAAIANPADDLRLLRILNVPARGIGQTSAERLREISLTAGQSISDTIRQVRDYPELQRGATKLILFGNLLTELREKAAEMPLDQFYDLLLDATGYLSMLQEKPEENAARIENIQELKSNIVSYMQNSEDGSLKGFLDEIALYTDLDNLDPDADAAVMMTMHSAKGLEFPHVYLVGMEEGIFPGHRVLGDPEEMEEERRLCYVALTRAKSKLHLISANQRLLFGRTTANQTSRFLEEIPGEYIEKEGVHRPAYRNDDWDIRFDDEAQGGYGAGPNTQRSQAPARDKKSWSHPMSPTGGTGQALPAFQKGDQVTHKAFGRGMITNIQPVGNDALIEIAFDGTGTKRLMLRAAAKQMTRV